VGVQSHTKRIVPVKNEREISLINKSSLNDGISDYDRKLEKSKVRNQISLNVLFRKPEISIYKTRRY
jgi:hypothetical protein